MDDLTFEQTLESIMPAIYSLANKYGRRTRIDADDLVQEACVRMVTMRDRYDAERAGEGGVTKFLLANAKLGILDAIRSQIGRNGQKWQPVSLSTLISEDAENEDDPAVAIAPASSSMDAMLEADLIDALHAATEGDGWDVLTYRLEGATGSEIGNELGLTESRICQRIQEMRPVVMAVLHGRPIPKTKPKPQEKPTIEPAEPPTKPASMFDAAPPSRQLSLFT